MDLRGKTVLLTGASTGLGPHIARRLRKAGATFVISARNEAALESWLTPRFFMTVARAVGATREIGRLGERRSHKR